MNNLAELREKSDMVRTILEVAEERSLVLSDFDMVMIYDGLFLEGAPMTVLIPKTDQDKEQLKDLVEDFMNQYKCIGG